MITICYKSSPMPTLYRCMRDGSFHNYIQSLSSAYPLSERRTLKRASRTKGLLPGVLRIIMLQSHHDVYRLINISSVSRQKTSERRIWRQLAIRLLNLGTPSNKQRDYQYQRKII